MKLKIVFISHSFSLVQMFCNPFYKFNKVVCIFFDFLLVTAIKFAITHTRTKRWLLFEMLYLGRDGVEPNIMLQGLHKTLTFCFWLIESINNGNMQSETRKEKVYYARSTSCQPHQTLIIVQFLNVAR